LLDTPDLLLESRKKPISNVPGIVYGSFALDDGNYTISAAEHHVICAADPAAAAFMRPFLGGEEFLHGTQRWCLWLANAAPASLKASPTAMQRMAAVRTWRASRDRAATQALAATPALFAEVRQPDTDYVAIPTVSSERRAFIPMGFLSANVVASNQLYVLPNASPYHFGVLSSTSHNAWLRAVCGRLESRYRYSAAIVYNNFPWPEVTDGERVAVEAAAQGVLDARGLSQQGEKPASLADLYDPLTMPPALVKAHQKLDAAVDRAYAATAKRLWGKEAPTTWKTDAERVAFLFRLYAHYTAPLAVEAEVKVKPAARRPRKAKKGPE
jgi:hypothetical protein